MSEADYSLATHAGQLKVTGTRLLDENGKAKLDAELPEIMAERGVDVDHASEPLGSKILAHDRI